MRRTACLTQVATMSKNDQPPPYSEYDRPAAPLPPQNDGGYTQHQDAGPLPPKENYHPTPNWGEKPQNHLQGWQGQPQTNWGEKPGGQQAPIQPPTTNFAPGTYVILPEQVNIANARQGELRPEYEEYLQRDQQRMQQGNFPNGNPKTNKVKFNQGPRPKHSSGFPGRSGATYHGAANE